MSLAMAIIVLGLVVAAAGVALAACARSRGTEARGRGDQAEEDGSAGLDAASMRDVLDAVPQPILVTHPADGRVFVANAAARALFAARGGGLDTLMPEELHADPAQRATFLSRLAGRGSVEDFPTRLVAADGHALDMRISARRLRFGGKEALCVILRDVTAQAAAEARHRAILAQVDAGVVLFDGEARVTYANPAAGRLLGRPAESLPGRPWTALVGPEGARPVLDALRSGAFSGARVGLSGALHGPQAETWLSLSAGPVTVAGEDRAVCSLVDVTDLKAAESALADSSEALRAVFDAAPLPILVLRRRGGDVLLANRPAQETFAPAVAGQGHWLDAYMDRAERRGLLAALARRGALDGQEVTVRPDGRSPRWMRIAANRLDYFGVEAVMIAFSDAAESRRLGRALAAAEADRDRAEEDLRQIASAADNDIAGPLRVAETTLDGLARRLDRQPAGDVDGLDVEALLARGLGAVRTAETRLGALAVYARIALYAARPAMVDLADVLQDVRHAMSVAIAREDAVLQVESLLPVLRADRAALAWALGHLVDNALKFRHPDRRPVIRLSARREPAEGGSGGEWHLRLSDNGQGIPLRHCDRAFGLFQRLHADGDTGPDAAGAGVGLAVCRRIIADHGGSIRLESTEGEGTTAHITLPATSADIVPLPGARGATG